MQKSCLVYSAYRRSRCVSLLSNTLLLLFISEIKGEDWRDIAHELNLERADAFQVELIYQYNFDGVVWWTLRFLELADSLAWIIVKEKRTVEKNLNRNSTILRVNYARQCDIPKISHSFVGTLLNDLCF